MWITRICQAVLPQAGNGFLNTKFRLRFRVRVGAHIGEENVILTLWHETQMLCQGRKSGHVICDYLLK